MKQNRVLYLACKLHDRGIVLCDIGLIVVPVTFHLGGFGLGRGRSRTCIFFCMSGVLFCAVAMAGGGLLSLLSSAGSAVWLLANLWLVLEEE